MSGVLSDEQRRCFHEDGFVRLAGALDIAVVTRMRDRLWHLLEHRGSLRSDPSTWRHEHGLHLQRVRDSDPDPRDCRPLVEVLDELIGAGSWHTSRSWGNVLVTFPNAATWDVPHRPWHLDYPYDLPRDAIWGANVFLFLDEVPPRGGGTVVLRGSPRLTAQFVERLRPAQRTQKQYRTAFDASDPYLKALSDPADTEDRVQRFAEVDTDVDGVWTRVVELTGQAGDLVLCHPWLIHNVAPNALDRPRLMRVIRVHHVEALKRFGSGEPEAHEVA